MSPHHCSSVQSLVKTETLSEKDEKQDKVNFVSVIIIVVIFSFLAKSILI